MMLGARFDNTAALRALRTMTLQPRKESQRSRLSPDSPDECWKIHLNPYSATGKPCRGLDVNASNSVMVIRC